MSDKTAVIEGRLDMRDLATCANFLISEGVRATSKSDLLYKIVASFANSAHTHHGSKHFDSTEEAMIYLESVGLGSMNRVKAEGRRANAFTLDRTIRAESVAGVQSAVDYAAIARKIMEQNKFK